MKIYVTYRIARVEGPILGSTYLDIAGESNAGLTKAEFENVLKVLTEDVKKNYPQYTFLTPQVQITFLYELREEEETGAGNL